MPGITIDTNIYVSALQYGGKPMSLLEAGLDGQVDIAVSQPIIEETLRVLREKFGWNAADLTDAETLIKAAARMVTPTRTIRAVQDDPDDDRIIECAVAADSECIVSGDKDLLRMKEYRGIHIMRISDFLERHRGPA